jgi:hypothetical protein
VKWIDERYRCIMLVGMLVEILLIAGILLVDLLK